MNLGNVLYAGVRTSKATEHFNIVDRACSTPYTSVAEILLHEPPDTFELHKQTFVKKHTFISFCLIIQSKKDGKGSIGAFTLLVVLSILRERINLARTCTPTLHQQT